MSGVIHSCERMYNKRRTRSERYSRSGCYRRTCKSINSSVSSKSNSATLNCILNLLFFNFPIVLRRQYCRLFDPICQDRNCGWVRTIFRSFSVLFYFTSFFLCTSICVPLLYVFISNTIDRYYYCM